VPEYFQDYCRTPSCNSVVTSNPSHSMTQRLVDVYFLRAMNLQLDLLTNFNTACSCVSLHRQLKTRLALSLAVLGHSPTQTHYTNQSKWERRHEKHPPTGCSCGMKLEEMSMTTTHFSNSDNSHCQI